MTDKDQNLERYLAEFQPRPIRKLAIPGPPADVWLRRLAAAAVIVLGAGISLWLGHRSNSQGPQMAKVQQPTPVSAPPPKKLSGFALTKLALENSQEFDAYLLYESRNTLPNLRGEHSTLRVLAKE